MIKRLGFACKYIDRPDQINNIKSTDAVKALNTSTTTVRWLNEHRDQAEDRLWSLAKHNIEAARRLVERVGSLDEQLRMVRLGSDLLPVYTEPTWRYFWQQPDVRHYAERAFMEVGDLARGLGVRLSFHPGQFCCVVSANPDIVSRSIAELEYHADMIRWMGFGQRFQDFKCNIHLSGRLGVDGFDAALNLMSPELRNCLTLENDEYQQNVDSLIKLKDKVAIVLDIHHHWIREGEYISANDDRVQRVLDSWRGVRPVCHYSVSREDVLTDHCTQTRPDMAQLLESGHKKTQLRAHSDFYWNTAVNDWALTFWDNFDIMCESKAKNLASFALYEHANTI
jgi:UV DNA damage repair endonuclease